MIANPEFVSTLVCVFIGNAWLPHSAGRAGLPAIVTYYRLFRRGSLFRSKLVNLSAMIRSAG